MTQWGLRSIVICLVVVGLVAAFLFSEDHEVSTPMGEMIGLDEDRAMAGAIGSALEIINSTRDATIRKQSSETPGSQPIYGRDVHNKSHGCLKANFIVRDLEKQYRWGVLSKPRTYPAWIRFSSADSSYLPDATWDARGMAIKLMGVEGDKLLSSQKKELTQDFIMMNNPNYFIRKLDDYVELTRYLARGDKLGYFANGFSPNLFSWHWRELRLVAGTKKRAPDTLLNTRFWSASAYKLGPDHNSKFSVKPVVCGANTRMLNSWVTPRSDDNFLRKRMTEQLAKAPACFDFMVQLQQPGKNMPVEDATIVWREQDAPFTAVARIEIPVQSFDDPAQNQFCEGLSFNPWHSLPEHRPLGVFNRVRKALYQEVARYRRAENLKVKQGTSTAPVLREANLAEPLSWCTDGQPADACGPVLKKAGRQD